MAGPYTIGDEEWKYLSTLNMCIQLLLVIMLGAVAGYLKIFQVESFVPQSTRFIFCVALPCLVINGLGIQIDLLDDKYLWRFIAVFLILRAIALVVAFGIVVIRKQNGIGQVAVLWLAMTWISTIIIGVPIASAVFKDPKVGQKYGVLAGISSFIFQLPVQLFFLECHTLEEEHLASKNRETVNPDMERADKVAPNSDQNNNAPEQQEQPENDNEVQNEASAITLPAENLNRMTLWLGFAKRGDIWLKILKQVIRNPVLCAIGIGFILDLSRLGPKYLKATSADFVPGLGWISSTLAFLGNGTVTPLALFTMGLWMEQQGAALFRMSTLSAVAFMVSKLVIVPFVALGLAKAMDLDDIGGRAAVLIAALPISMASFSLANRYGIGEAIMAENVALGTLLVLPTIIIWNLILDEIDVYPIPE